ncbi:MAG TPA: PAS domain S-box protein [Methylomirabilota bacterium]|nr:PAS domain S-box protein [Methylomirabilota bacterium]
MITELTARELRETGISVIGDVRWGTHFCYFYETRQDLLDTLVLYFKAGLEHNEFCLWVVSQPLTVDEAKRALEQAVPDLDRLLAEGSIEIHGHDEWYLHNGQFEPERVIQNWREKLNQALAGGYVGMRASGDTAWVQKEQRTVFREYEKKFDALSADQRMIVLCTYPLTANPAAQICDAARFHQVAVARQHGTWEIVETPELRQAQAEIKRLNDQLQRATMKTPKPTTFRGYGAAVLSVTAALIIARWLDIHAVTAPVSLFLCALMFSTWYGGLKPGLLAMALSLLAFDFCFVAPINSLAIEIQEIPRFLIFALAALFVVSLSVAQRSATDSLRRARDALEGSVQELRRTNESLQAENAERRRAEEALKQAESHLRLVLDTTPALINTGRPDGYLDNFNQRWLKYVGLSLEELQGWAWTSVIHPEDVDGMVNRWRASLASGELFQYEARVRRADGEYRWMLHHKVPLRDEHGNIGKWYGSSIDIEDRKQAEEALRESEQRFRRLVELMPVAVYVCDTSGIIQSYNKRAAELWGREPKPGDTAQRYCGSLRLYSPDGKLVPHEESPMAEVLKTGIQASDVEMVMERPDGSCITVLVNIAPLRNADGEVIGAMNCFQDITERRSAAEELKKEKEILAKVFDNIPVMIGFVGDDGGIKLVNPEWERTIGWTLKELQEQKVDIFAEAYPDPSYRQKVLDFVAASTGEWADLKIKVRNGRVIDAACAVVHLSDGTKVAIARDITERKQAEEKLKATSEQLRALSARLQSAREEEAARIAREIHDDLGQQLTGLKMDLRRAERKLEGLESSPVVNSLLDTIVNATELTDKITTSVQEIAANLRPEMLDKLGLSAALHYEARRFQERTGVLCEVLLPETEPTLSTEASTALFRIFKECLTNIVRHAHPTKVEAALGLENGRMTLRVEDNGRGITEAEIANPESLGLLGMKERAALLGGEIVFQRGTKGGTIVNVRLPHSGTPVQPKELV